MGDIDPIDPEAVLAFEFPERNYTYTERDVALYALGVGACRDDACDPMELPYVYHPHGQSLIKVLPTFAVLFPFGVAGELNTIPGLNFHPSLLLHGEQYLEICKPLPTSGQVKYKSRISQLHDKGKAAVVELESVCRNADNEEVLCVNRTTCFLRGAGGFSASSSKPFTYNSRTPSTLPTTKLSNKQPDFPPLAVYEDQLQPNQALLYRLSGDYNPLHSDPQIASIAGFPRPILHGLCTLGFAVRAVIRCCAAGDPSLVQTVQGRFLLHVFPGETLITEMWKERNNVRTIIFHCKVKERDQIVLSGVVTLLPSSRL
eukprot:c19540_g1_i1 orf=408-1355(-)